MPMAANSCDETDYSYIDGMTFGNTAAGLQVFLFQAVDWR